MRRNKEMVGFLIFYRNVTFGLGRGTGLACVASQESQSPHRMRPREGLAD